MIKYRSAKRWLFRSLMCSAHMIYSMTSRSQSEGKYISTIELIELYLALPKEVQALITYYYYVHQGWRGTQDFFYKITSQNRLSQHEKNVHTAWHYHGSFYKQICFYQSAQRRWRHVYKNELGTGNQRENPIKIVGPNKQLIAALDNALVDLTGVPKKILLWGFSPEDDSDGQVMQCIHPTKNVLISSDITGTLYRYDLIDKHSSPKAFSLKKTEITKFTARDEQGRAVPWSKPPSAGFCGENLIVVCESHERTDADLANVMIGNGVFILNIDNLEDGKKVTLNQLLDEQVSTTAKRFIGITDFVPSRRNPTLLLLRYRYETPLEEMVDNQPVDQIGQPADNNERFFAVYDLATKRITSLSDLMLDKTHELYWHKEHEYYRKRYVADPSPPPLFSTIAIKQGPTDGSVKSRLFKQLVLEFADLRIKNLKKYSTDNTKELIAVTKLFNTHGQTLKKTISNLYQNIEKASTVEKITQHLSDYLYQKEHS